MPRLQAPLAALAALGLSLLPLPSGAKKARIAPCPPGRYVVDVDEPLGPAGAPGFPDAIEVDAQGRVSIESSCPTVEARLKGSRRGTRVKAKWAKGTCAGLSGKVKLEARTDSSCRTLTGKLKAKKHKRKFTATRALAVGVEVDADRRAAANLGPAGGSVSATGADGTVYTLALPEGALAGATEIAITPVAAITDLPFSGGLVGGAQFEPEGLVPFAPGTLRIEPPGGIAVPDGLLLAGFGYRGSGEGFGLGLASSDGATLAIPVHHFSGAGGGFAAPADLEGRVGTGAPGDGFVAELISVGGEVDELRLAHAAEILETWYFALIRPLLQAGAVHDVPLARAVVELAFWQNALESGTAASYIQVDPAELLAQLAAALEDARSLLADALRQGIARANARCLDDESLLGGEDALRWAKTADALLPEERLFAEQLDRETVLADLCVQVLFEEIGFPQQPIIGEGETLSVVAGHAFGSEPTRFDVPIDVTALPLAGLVEAAESGQTDAQGRFAAVFTPNAAEVRIQVEACLAPTDPGLDLVLGVCQSAFVVRGLVVTPSSVTLAPGGSQQFAATLQGAPIDVAWSASGGSIDANGRFTAPGAGSYTVTATAVSDSGLAASAQVTVEEGGGGGLPSGQIPVTVRRFTGCVPDLAFSGPGFALIVGGGSSIALSWVSPSFGDQQLFLVYDGPGAGFELGANDALVSGLSHNRGIVSISETSISGSLGTTSSTAGFCPFVAF
jgi:hypothetical protein